MLEFNIPEQSSSQWLSLVILVPRKITQTLRLSVVTGSHQITIYTICLLYASVAPLFVFNVNLYGSVVLV